MKIAIDGPSGAGKSTMAKKLAAVLGITYLDTGAMYRAIGLKAYREGIATTQEDKLQRLLDNTEINIQYKDGIQKIVLDGEDVSLQIREHYVSKLASDFSAVPIVRLKLVEMQRALANKADCVLDGRDIGTYVLPDADIKFYLTASLEERTERRYAELTARGEKCDKEKIRQDISNRDYNDMHREFAPLKKAEDAIELDTTGLDIETVTSLMIKEIKKVQ